MHERPRLPWITPLTRLWPNLFLATLAIAVALVEAVLLARSTDNVYAAGGFTPLLAIAYLAWFWYAMSWGLFYGGSLLAHG